MSLAIFMAEKRKADELPSEPASKRLNTSTHPMPFPARPPLKTRPSVTPARPPGVLPSRYTVGQQQSTPMPARFPPVPPPPTRLPPTPIVELPRVTPPPKSVRFNTPTSTPMEIDPRGTSGPTRPAAPHKPPSPIVPTRKSPSPPPRADSPVGDDDPRIPAPIRALIDKKQFDIVNFLNETEVRGLTLADLLQWSPALRERLRDAMKLVPKVRRAALCFRKPLLGAWHPDTEPPDHDNDNTLDGRLDFHLKALSKVDVSATGTHYMNALIQNSPAKCLFDGGCCLIAISAEVRKRHQWTLTKVPPTFHLRQVDGSAPKLEGEVHNLVVTIEGHQVPINVLSIVGMDAECLLGRPFLEMVMGITHWKNSIYHFKIHGSWILVQGSTGETREVRTLTAAEEREWDQHGRTPLLDITPPAPRTRSQTRQANISSLIADGFKVEIDHTGDQTLADIRSGALFGILQTEPCPPLPGDDYSPDSDQMDFRINLLRTFANAPVPNQITVPAFRQLKQALQLEPKLPEFTLPATHEFRFLTWNVNSLRNLVRKGVDLGSLFNRLNLDIVCFQEIKCSRSSLPLSLTDIPGYRSFWSLSETKQGVKGVGTYVRAELAATLRKVTTDADLPIDPDADCEGRVLALDFDQCTVINVYYPNGGMGDADQQAHAITSKIALHQTLLQIATAARTSGRHVIFAGDFNVAHTDSDVHPNLKHQMHTGVTPAERQLLTHLTDHDFVDTYTTCHPDAPAGDGYTTWWFSKHARERNIGL
ncbi:Endonuclease/exonuclease/phosphatase [Fimicolochytrium jonesii]|uniref:Endonuclease/exonuclease/phosphatase n=1 Tax=Fimicolochytrium jonesii TaxID=1396493 RepID=UPI0022FF0865|nr:Endonuclease/exonuclease/phosphatase [Fimicolochytrium jonesii]KAI8817785.1 Endonuclease/exonuclease/phosphatase [Fimicolochytrium jonesii]